MWLGAAECVAHWGIYNPSRPALVVDGAEATYGQVASAAVDLARVVEKYGLAGKRVAIICRDKAKLLCSLVGVQLAGASVVLPHPTWTTDALTATLVDTKPSAFIADDDWSEFLAQKFRDKPRLLPIELDRHVGAHLATKVYSGLPRRDVNSEWGLIFSSGSTGLPKPIVQTNYSMMTECVAWCIELGICRGQTFYVGRPLYYTGGLVLALATLMCRGQVILDHYKDQNSGAELAEKLEVCVSNRSVRWCFTVPEVVRDILGLVKLWSHPANPESFLIMGSKIYGHEKQSLANIFGATVVESWGNSEGLGTITDPEDLQLRTESVGRPFLTERLGIVDENLVELPPKQVGLLAGSDETMFKEYANLPEITQRTKRADLVISDDLGYRDIDGYFYILGRADEVLVLPAKTVSMPSVENAIRGKSIPNLKDVFVCGQKRRNRVAASALVSVEGGVDTTSIQQSIIQILQEQFGTSGVSFRVVLVNEIPKLISGKTDRVQARFLLSET